MPDNYDLWEAHQREQDKLLESCEICDECGEHIQDECYYNIGGRKMCQNCIEDCRVWI